jgi:hypothetical protein
MHVIGGTLAAFALLGLVLLVGGCGLQRLEDFPQRSSDWKTTVQKAREAKNPRADGGE